MKVAIVTGGGSGLGLSTVSLLQSKGYKVAIWDRNPSQISLPNTLFCEVDVTSSDSITKALNKTLHQFSKIDALINCAGISIAISTLTSKYVHDLNSFNTVLNVNLIGLFDVCRQVSKVMDGGVIVTVGSVASFEGNRGQVAYSASKGGVAALTLPMARDLATKRIRVVCICPGLFETPMGDLVREEVKQKLKTSIALGRFGKSEEFAHTALFAVENEYMNGCLIRLDGGAINPHI